ALDDHGLLPGGLGVEPLVLAVEPGQVLDGAEERIVHGRTLGNDPGWRSPVWARLRRGGDGGGATRSGRGRRGVHQLEGDGDPVAVVEALDHSDLLLHR